MNKYVDTNLPFFRNLEKLDMAAFPVKDKVNGRAEREQYVDTNLPFFRNLEKKWGNGFMLIVAGKVLQMQKAQSTRV